MSKFWEPPPVGLNGTSPEEIKRKEFPGPPLRISRVGQLDTALLDNELESILVAPVWKALAMLQHPAGSSWQPELLALLRFAVLRLSLWETSSTYGSRLQNLKYSHANGKSALSRRQKMAYISFAVIPAYLHSRIRDRLLGNGWADEPLPKRWLSLFDLRRLSKTRRRVTGEEPQQLAWEWKRTIWELIGLGEKVGALFGLINFLIFLYNGRFRTVVDRILKMRLVYAERSVNHAVSFEFLNRQLVWEAFTEFLLFLMPLVNLRRIQQQLGKMISKSRSTTVASLLSALPVSISRSLGLRNTQPTQTKEVREKQPIGERPLGVLHFLPPTTCPICYETSTAAPTELPAGVPVVVGPSKTTVCVPYITDCGWGCRYCYYCISEKLAMCAEDREDEWICLRCGEPVHEADREKLEVLEGPVEEQVKAGDVSSVGVAASISDVSQE